MEPRSEHVPAEYSLITELTLRSLLIQHAEDIPEPTAPVAGQDLYFEVLELQPIKLLISFMRTERVSSEEKYVIARSYEI